MSWLLERLRKCQDDRGMMANLRCILVDNKKHRAWPALNRLGVAIENDVAAFVAGLFATHPEVTTVGNFGDTCKSTEQRFQHLLSAERGDELNDRILRMVLMAKSQGVAVNYEKLETDLKYWGKSDRVKTEWAAAFWTPGVATATEEVA